MFLWYAPEAQTISIYFPKMTISSVSSDKSLTSNDGYEKGQQDTKKRSNIQKSQTIYETI